MLIVYLSLSGNTENFVGRLEMESIKLDYSNPLTKVEQDYIVIVPSYDDDITEVISRFINYENNFEYLKAFAGSGNRNFNEDFCFNARDLSNKYNKPLMYEFEFSGTDKDIANFRREVLSIEIT